MMPSEVAAPPPMLSFSTPNSRATTGSSPMDQVFFSFYCKLARACLRKTSTSFRSFLEHCVLLLAGAYISSVHRVFKRVVFYILKALCSSSITFDL